MCLEDNSDVFWICLEGLRGRLLGKFGGWFWDMFGKLVGGL